MNRRTRWIAAFAALVTMLGILAPTAAIALPDPAPADLTAVATLTKTSSASSVAPGEPFTYTLTIGCSSITDTGCKNAVLTDVVPAPFQVLSATVGAGVNTAADPVVTGNTVTATWVTPLGDGATGILDATTGVVEITAVLPVDASYDTSGIPVLNNAVIEGTNFADASDQVPVTPVIPLVPATTASKSFSPASLIATEGAPVTAVLGGVNQSNASVESLTIQDPENPGATPNPFTFAAFTGFGSITPPAGADPTDTVYEVYVGGAWVPYTGDPTGVLGTRVTFNGSIPPGATASVDLGLELTALAAAQDDGTPVANDVTSTVVRDGQDATDDADASLVLRQNTVTVGAAKSFSPALVIAGQSSTVTLGASNQSTIPIESLTITEPATGSFPAQYTFGGFSDDITYPAGATTGTVIYRTAGGDIPVTFASDTTPALPPGVAAEDVTSFQVVLTGTSIPPGAETSIPFTVDTAPDAAPLPATVPNEVGVAGSNAGVEGTAVAADDLYVYDEVIEPYIGKQIRPTEILASPGEDVTVSLTGGLTERPNPPATPTGSTGNAQQIVLQDPLDPVEPNAWWNAFDLTAITQTPVPSDASLTVEYYDTTDDTWKTLAGPIAGPTISSSAVPGAIQDVAGGVRFIYDYTDPDAAGFPPGTDFAPNFSSELRSTGRYGTPPYNEDTNTVIPNCAQSGASSSNPGVPDGAAAMDPAAPVGSPGACPVITLIPTETGAGDLIEKEFGTSSSGGVKSVIARSGDTIPSVLSWSTGGYSDLARVEVTDVASPALTPLVSSVFNAFNVTRIQPITPATDPLIRYDQVAQVLLWNGVAWVAAANDPCPAGCIGQFPGMNLTAAEQASTTGIRLVFVESPNRAAASVGRLDAPAVGSGVARSFDLRPVTVTWQVRDTRRTDGTPVLGDELYNLADDGVVRNTVNATGFPADGGAPLSENDQDDVVIIDVPITTSTDKNWFDGPISIPYPDSGILPSAYPISRIRITTRNTTPARVDQLWITDPAPGSPSTVFDTQQFGGFLRIDDPTGADPAQTFVDLSFADGTVITYDRASALALTEATVPGGHGQVVGFQVRYAGRIASGAAGVVEVRLRLKPINSATGLPVSTADSPATNVAEGIVADVDPPGVCPPPGGNGAPRYACDQGAAALVLTDPSFGLEVTKSFSPAEQKEPDDTPVVMNLSGQPSGSTRAVTMIIGDADPAFWNAFDLVGIDPRFTLTNPIARVQACYVAGGTFSVDAGGGVVVTGGEPNECSPSGGTLAEAVALFEAAPPDVQQITFQFWSENGLGWTNPANPRQTVPVLVQRRAELRTGGPVPTTRSDQVAAPGQPAAGIFDNRMSGLALSAEVGAGVPLVAQDDDAAQYRYLHRQNTISVTKTPNGDVRPGVAIPYTLRFTNTGERPITNPVFIDELPMDAQGAQLIFDPDRDPSVSPYSFALIGSGPDPQFGTPLPTNPAQLTIDEQSDRIVFTPPPGSALAVGQTYTITIQLMLRPGITPDVDVRNVATITADEPFDDCITTPAGGVTAFCSDDAIVSPLSIPALSTVKSVRGDAAVGIDGVPEVFSTANGFDCAGTAVAGFYRAPCVPVTRPGGTETWRFTVTNAGTLPLDRVVSIDNLPTPGDQGLIVTLPRESVWQPTFVGDIVLSGAPPGATLQTAYSTSSTPCTADLNPLGAACAPGAWLPLTGAVDPTIVRSVKFTVVFPVGDLFLPGEAITLEFRTRTTPTASVASAYPIAYNTVSTGGSALSAGVPVSVPATEGRRVGVSYPTGPLQLEKVVTGDASEFAPATFPVTVACTSLGVPVTGIPGVVLVAGAGPVTVSGIPWGASCTATEGQWGQTQTVIGTTTVRGPEDVIGLVRVTNIFNEAGLTVRKTVDAAGVDQRGDPIEYGPFDFTVVCDFAGDPRYADGYGPTTPMQASISPGETWALAGLQVGTECTVTETDDLDAESTAMSVTVDGVSEPTVDGTTVDVTIIDAATVEVVATNTFAAGDLLLEKVVTGAGGDDYGDVSFVFVVQCVLDTGDGPAQVYAGVVTIVGEGDAEITDIAAGAECTVREIVNGGATDIDIAPTPAVIGADDSVTVTVTNTFEAGSLTVTKVIEGEGADAWGAGPFEVALSCTTPLGQPVDIPGGGVRELSAGNGYTTTYEPLLVGVLCGLEETDTGGATSSVITDDAGDPAGIFRVEQQDYAFTVTNTFDIGAFTVMKTVTGADAAAHRSDVFRVSAACTLDGDPLVILGGADRALSTATPVRYAGLPVGAECTVRETDAGTASAVTLTPADPTGPGRALVVVTAGAEASVTIDNRFDPLAATGVEGSRAIAAGVLAVLLLGAGMLLIARSRRRTA